VTVVTPEGASATNPFILTETQERELLAVHSQNKHRISIPRRPRWDKTTTPELLDEKEKSSFLEWRKSLVALEEQEALLLTPYERNLEVWRQLWRVVERADLVIQIVDARNPMLFRCEDLETYVKQVDPKKGNLLLVNKADLLSKTQRYYCCLLYKTHSLKENYGLSI
jgi:large subunit GTPase 1